MINWQLCAKECPTNMNKIKKKKTWSLVSQTSDRDNQIIILMNNITDSDKGSKGNYHRSMKIRNREPGVD